MSQRKNPRQWARLPLLLSIALSAGVFIGAKMFGRAAYDDSVQQNIDKWKAIFNHIDRQYVDTVNINELSEYGITQMLGKLDPHTSYIPAKDLQEANERLEGNFEGIGIEFNIFRDTISVVTVLSGGPAEAVGLQSGDKIISVDGKKVAGVKINTQGVFNHLKGKGGTKVAIAVKRRGQNQLLDFNITRDRIPIQTVDAAYMIDAKTGYIKVNRFGSKTYDEFEKGLESLQKSGMEQLVLDLRDNPGGYLGTAIKMADDFLPADRMIVYTKGKNVHTNDEEKATSRGIFEKGALIVLINEGSASASEIVAGTLQDNDRALIVGRRSFGKGLVQKPIALPDGSEIRLTISRYYTPSNRSIQKPYEKGHGEEYAQEYYNRASHGELYHADSVKFDEKQKYTTLLGRTVYGGGGIMPDFFVARDTSYYTDYLNKLYSVNLLREYALNYASDHKKQFSEMSLETFSKKFVVSEAMLSEVLNMAQEAGIQYNEKEFLQSKTFVANQIKSLIAKNFWQNEGLYRILGERDEVLNQSLRLFDKARNLEKGEWKEAKKDK
jgi:carboxyl-terminal processing protease